MENFANFSSIKGLSSSHFDTLFRISQILNSSKNQETLFEDSLDLVIEALNAERGVFVKYSPDLEMFDIIAARNIQKETIDDITAFSSGLIHKVIEAKTPLLYHDVQSDPTISQFQSVQIQDIKSVIGVPVFYNDTVWGVILADSRKFRKDFSEDSLQLLKFFSNMLSLSFEKLRTFEKLEDENRILLNRLEKTDTLPNMIGESSAIRSVAKLIHKVARTDATVLILGESGTGKDLAAQAIHQLSKRADQPYLAQFCSIPDNLLESELFGVKKGAFTDAKEDKKGLFEVANNGTFFLDEIGDISGALQAKLLRVLENQEIMRLGDTKYKKLNVRVITATNKNLPQMSKEGKFREDLFYRLNVFPIKLPPLRERKEDIPLLADHFIKKLGNGRKTLSSGGLQKLENYIWPGNIRQFINVIQRALILADSNKVNSSDIVLEEESSAEEFQGTLKDFEKIILKKRLQECNNNRTLAAKSLGVSVRWVQNKIKEMGYPD